MFIRALWNRQRNLTKEQSAWLYSRVINVCVCITEFFVKKIFNTESYETVPFGQTVTDESVN